MAHPQKSIDHTSADQMLKSKFSLRKQLLMSENSVFNSLMTKKTRNECSIKRIIVENRLITNPIHHQGG